MASEQEKFLDRLRKLERQLDKLTTDFFYCEAFLDTPRGSFWQPPTDVYETDSDVVVRIEAPGLDVTDILIVIRSNALLVRGVRRDTARPRRGLLLAAAGRDPATIGMEGRVTWAGDPDRALAEIAAWRAAGASHVSINTMGAGLDGVDEHLAVLERLAQR